MLATLGVYPLAWSAPGVPDSTNKPVDTRELFEFHSGFWLNLHHFLYITARARLGLDATRNSSIRVLQDTEGFGALTANDRMKWSQAVSYYESKLARRDVIFDADMRVIDNQLARVDSAARLPETGMDPMLAGTLERAGQVYRQLWWPRHDAANRAWLSGVRQLLTLYGNDLAARESRAFRQPWSSSPVRVDVVAYANWAGAYATNNPSHIIVSSSDAGNQDDQALEVLFHEVLHTMDGTLRSALRAAFQARGKPLPPDPTHAFIFYTAGVVTHQALPHHVPYAEKNGLWERAPDFKRALPMLRQSWQTYLEGKSTFDEALARYAAAW